MFITELKTFEVIFIIMFYVVINFYNYQKFVVIMVLCVKILQVVFVRIIYILGGLYLLESYIYCKYYVYLFVFIRLLVAFNIISCI